MDSFSLDLRDPRELPRGPLAGPILRRTPDRACWCEGGEFLKSFRARSAWRRLFDSRRVRLELAAAGRLQELGVPAPVPLGATRRRDPGGRMHRLARFEQLPGCDLERALERGLDPGRGERLATSLGWALAKLHASGLRHTDLHPGNLAVLEPADTAALLDLRQVRRGPSQPDLVRLGAELLGRVDRRAVVRFMRAYGRTAGRPLERKTWRELGALALALRERLVDRLAARWLRPSIRVRRFGEAWIATPSTDAQARARLAWLDSEASAPSSLVIHRGSSSGIRRRWLDAAAAVERARLDRDEPPALRPLVLRLRGERSAAALELPAESRHGV